MVKLAITSAPAVPPMQWIQQRGDRDCGLCVTAMLAGLSYEEVQADVPDYENTPAPLWLDYLVKRGWSIYEEPIAECRRGHRYYCVVAARGEHDKRRAHAIAVDENGTVFDPGRKITGPNHYRLTQYSEPPLQLCACYQVWRPPRT